MTESYTILKPSHLSSDQHVLIPCVADGPAAVLPGRPPHATTTSTNEGMNDQSSDTILKPRLSFISFHLRLLVHFLP